MLFDPDRHETLVRTAWDETLARDVIQRIAADARAAFSPSHFWPIHPSDVSPERAATLKPIYYGAAGVIWALDYLVTHGAIAPGHSYAQHLPPLLNAHRADSLRLTGQPILGYPIGDAGILLLQHKLAPSAAAGDDLFRVIASNALHPARGLVWGGAGSMLAALFMFERTGHSRWRELFLHVLDGLWDCWEYDANAGCHLWMTDLYGAREQRMMALHGLPGIVFPMLRGRALLSAERAAVLVERVCAAIMATAIREGGFANWPLSVGASVGRGTDIPYLQHCIGAPGIVNSFATQLPPIPVVDQLLIAAGDLCWHAGPLVKLPSLCHGAPGTGFAFLKLHARTGEQRWLQRARQFAMHAIAQNERFTRHYGVRKYSLWTGDLGLAVYLWHCIHGTALVPTLDEF